MMTFRERFKIAIVRSSNDVWGWNGRLIDKQEGKSYPLIKIVGDGHGAAMRCAYDTRDELMRAARRMAKSIAR